MNNISSENRRTESYDPTLHKLFRQEKSYLKKSCIEIVFSMNLEPKKDGSPNIDFFQSAESLQGFETVRLWLQKHHKKVRKICLKNGLHDFVDVVLRFQKFITHFLLISLFSVSST